MTNPKLKTLNELAWVPKPLLSPLEWAVAKALVNNPSLQVNLPLLDCPLEGIEPTQWRLDINQVEKFVKDQNFDGGLCFTRSVGAADDINSAQMYLWDGHHRYFAAQKAGLTQVRNRVFHLLDIKDIHPYEEGMTLDQFAAQLDVPKEAILLAMDSDDRSRYEGPINERKEPEPVNRTFDQLNEAYRVVMLPHPGALKTMRGYNLGPSYWKGQFHNADGGWSTKESDSDILGKDEAVNVAKELFALYSQQKLCRIVVEDTSTKESVFTIWS